MFSAGIPNKIPWMEILFLHRLSPLASIMEHLSTLSTTTITAMQSAKMKMYCLFFLQWIIMALQGKHSKWACMINLNNPLLGICSLKGKLSRARYWKHCVRAFQVPAYVCMSWTNTYISTPKYCGRRKAIVKLGLRLKPGKMDSLKILMPQILPGKVKFFLTENSVQLDFCTKDKDRCFKLKSLAKNMWWKFFRTLQTTLIQHWSALQSKTTVKLWHLNVV